MNFFASLANLWRMLTISQKAALAIAVVILGALVVVAINVGSQPGYAPLYGSLSDEDAASVVQKLKDLKVDYRISNNGAVEVPEQKVNELRMTMAGDGIPKGGGAGAGFELFDKAQLGQSEFGERLNYLRALQTELARTINQLESVRTVRVHLVIPEKRLFESNDHVASASVVLGLKGASPSPREIKSIIHLVSTAVEGLSPANVTVVDTKGNLLSDAVNAAGGGDTDTRLQDQRVAETQIETRLQSMLDQVLGPEKAVVRVHATINYDNRRVDRESYTPSDVGADKNRGVIGNISTTTETYGGGANPPRNAATATLTPPAAGSSTGYNRTENTTTYHVSKQTEHVEYAPGQISEVKVALLLDQSVKAEDAARLQETVANAAGTTKESVAVQSMPFDTTAAKTAATEAQKADSSARMQTITRVAVPMVLIIVFLGILLVIYRSVGQVPMKAEILPDARPYPALAVPDHALGQYHAMSGALPGASDDLGADGLPRMDPRRVAQVIQSLLGEEEG